MKESTELRATRMVRIASFPLTTTILAFLAFAQPTTSNIAAGYLSGIFLVLGTIAICSCTGTHRRFLKFFRVVANIESRYILDHSLTSHGK